MSRKVALLALLALVLGACHRQDKPAVDAVARFGDHRLAYADFQRYLDANAGEGANDLSSEVLSELFDQFLDEQLLTQLAADRGLTPQGGTARKGLERLLELEAGAVSEDQVAAYYHAHPEEFSRPERVRLQQILTDSKATAEAARKRLADGADFAAVAREVSKAPEGATGTELAKADLPPELAEAIFNLKLGEVSPVIPAPYGFHLFKVEARLPAEQLSLEDASAEIHRRLADQASDQRLESLLGEARSRYNLELYAQNLPFDYRGRYLRNPPA